jgi:chromosome segregation ATPase
LQRLTGDAESLESHLHETRENLQSSRNFASELERRVDSLKKENETLEQKLKDVTSAHEGVVKTWETRCGNSEERAEKLERDLKESRERLMSLLQDSLGDVESVRRDLERELDEVRRDSEYYEKEAAAQEKRVSQFLEMWTEEKKRADDLSGLLDDRSKGMDDLHASEQLAQEQLQDMQRRFEEEERETKTKVSALEEGKQSLEELVKSLQLQLEREEALVQHAQQWKDAHDAEVIARGKDHQRMKELDDSFAKMTERFDESEKSREILEIEMNKVREENIQLSEEIAKQVENFTSLAEHRMDRMEECNAENDELLPAPTAEEERELRMEIGRLRVQLELVNDRLNEKSRSFDESQRDNVELEQRNSDLRARLARMPSVSSSLGQEEEKWKDMEQKVNILNESNLHLRGRNNVLSAEVDALKREVDSGKMAVMEAKDLSAERERRIEVLGKEKKQAEELAELRKQRLHSFQQKSNTVNREEHEKMLAKAEERQKSAEKDCADARQRGMEMVDRFKTLMAGKDKDHKEKLEQEMANKDAEISSFSLRYLREMKRCQELEKRLSDLQHEFTLLQHEFALLQERCGDVGAEEDDKPSRKRGVEEMEEMDHPVGVEEEEEEVPPPSKRKKMTVTENFFVEEMNGNEELDEVDGAEVPYFQPEGDDDAAATAGMMETLASDGVEIPDIQEDEVQIEGEVEDDGMDDDMEDDGMEDDGVDGVEEDGLGGFEDDAVGDENVEEGMMEGEVLETMGEEEGEGQLDGGLYSSGPDEMIEGGADEGEEYGIERENLGEEEVEEGVEEEEGEEREMESHKVGGDGPIVRQIQRPELDDIGIPIPSKIKRSIFDDDGISTKPFSTFVPAASREKTEEDVRKSRQARFAEGSARPPPRHKMLSESLPGLPMGKKPQPQGKEAEEKEDEEKQ